MCNECQLEYEANEQFFYKSKKSKDGLRGICKKCTSIKQKGYYEKNREKIKKQKQKYYQENRETLLENTAIYYQENVEKIKQYHKELHHSNKQRENERSKHYYQKNKENFLLKQKRRFLEKPEVYKMYAQKRRALKESLPATLTEQEWTYLKETFNNKCAYCGEASDLAQDHFVPLSKGGPYTIENIIPACKRCNSSKRNSDFSEWYKHHGSYSRERENKINQHIKSLQN